MLSKKLHGNSLIEVVVTLLIFSAAIAIISRQIDMDISRINTIKNAIAEIYRNGV